MTASTQTRTSDHELAVSNLIADFRNKGLTLKGEINPYASSHQVEPPDEPDESPSFRSYLETASYDDEDDHLYEIYEYEDE